jgi:hypothetical protein
VPIDPNDPNSPVFSDPTVTDPNGFQSMFDGVSGAIVVLFVVIVVFAIAIAVRNASRAIDQGQNPLTVDYDLKLKALDSAVLSPERSTEEKLAEVEQLFAAGTITADERAAARERILGSL